VTGLDLDSGGQSRTPADIPELTCDTCGHSPVSVLAVMGRTYVDRSPAPGHVLRLCCGACAGRTRDILAKAGRAVTFLVLAPETLLAAENTRLAGALRRLASQDWLGTQGSSEDELERRREYAEAALRTPPPA